MADISITRRTLNPPRNGVIAPLTFPQESQNTSSATPQRDAELFLDERTTRAIVSRWAKTLDALPVTRESPTRFRDGKEIVQILEGDAYDGAAGNRKSTLGVNDGNIITINGSILKEYYSAARKAFPQLSPAATRDLVSDVSMPVYAHEMQHRYDRVQTEALVGKKLPDGIIRENQESAYYTEFLAGMEMSKLPGKPDVVKTLFALADAGSPTAKNVALFFDILRKQTTGQSIAALKRFSDTAEDPSERALIVLTAGQEANRPVINALMAESKVALEVTVPRLRSKVEASEKELGFLEGTVREESRKNLRVIKELNALTKRNIDEIQTKAVERVETLSTLNEPKNFGLLVSYYNSRTAVFAEKRERILGP